MRIIIYQAECDNINVAFENLGNIQNLDLVLTNIDSENARFCYDSCHHVNYAPDYDILKKYGKRLMALHLQDNGGRNNQHQLPFDGNIKWAMVMEKISLMGYKGATTLEPMNWDYVNLTIQEFLNSAYQKAKMLDEMRTL